MLNVDEFKLLWRLFLVICALCVLNFGFTTFAFVRATDRASVVSAAVQQSRFDSSFAACVHTNARHDNALVYIKSLDKLNPEAGLIAANLLNVLSPLRDGKDGRISCQQYATQEVALNFSPPSASLHSSTPTSK